MESQVAIRTPQWAGSTALEISGKHLSKNMVRHSWLQGAIDGWMKCFHPGFLAPTEEEPEENNTVWVPNRFFKWK